MDISVINRVAAHWMTRVGLFAVLWAAWPMMVQADRASHHEAAAAFYEEVREDPKVLSETITGLLGQLQPGIARHGEVLKAFAMELLSSSAYRETRINVYMEFLDEEELRTLVWLFRHDTLRRYRSLNLKLVNRNTQAIIDMFRDSLPELQRRIVAGGARAEGSSGSARE